MTESVPTPEICNVKPVQFYMSTNLNNKIKTYEDLSERILNMLGYPAVSISDIHANQIHQAISMAVERFTRYAGFTKEYLIFDSRLYEPNKGVPIDKLFTVASLWDSKDSPSISRVTSRGPEQYLDLGEDVYVTKTYIKKSDYYISGEDYNILMKSGRDEDKETIKYLYEMSKKFPDGIEELSIISQFFYDYLLLHRGYSQEQFKKSRDKVFTQDGEKIELYKEKQLHYDIYSEDEKDLLMQTEDGPLAGRRREDINGYNQMFDYDLMDYRKVVSVVSYEETNNTAMSALFSFDTALAQQFFYANQFHSHSFGLTTWYCLHEWRNTYEKLLQTKKDFSFNNRTQYFMLNPQPKPWQFFYGLLECWVEKPLKDVIVEPWVFDYALAVVKEMLGRVRSKWGDGTNLIGGGSLTGNALATEGVQKQKELMDELMQKQAYGAASPTRFFVG